MKKIKYISLTLSVTLGLTFINPVRQVKAASDNENNNIQFLNDNINNDVYTYNQGEISTFSTGQIGGGGGSSLTTWKYSSTIYGNSNFSSLTKTIIIGGISQAVSSKIKSGFISGIASTAITLLASQVLGLNRSTIYYKKVYYYKFIIGTSWPRAEKSVTTYYSDSARTKQIGSPITNEYYVPGWN